MEKEEISKMSKNSRSRLDALIDILIDREKLLSSVSGKWRVKDVLVHISWHEREMENLVKTMNLEGSPYWLLPTHERNDKIFQEFFDLNTEKIVQEYKQSFTDMMGQFSKLPSNATVNPTFFKNMPKDWQPWKVFAGNMFKHYEDHIVQLKNRFDFLK
ncbi:MAG: hypothetical protein ACW99A_11060 [Candidatus Kariarchaeaceae archaeon]|jgi:hypothetical protein